MKITREEANTLLEGIRAREQRKRKPEAPGEPTHEAPPEEPESPKIPRARNLRILLPIDLWKAIHHAAIDLDKPVQVIAIRALEEFVARTKEPK